MIVAPVITGTIIFLLMALSPCIFAFTFKSKACDGYCLGLCVFILTAFLLGITLLIALLIVVLRFRNQLVGLVYLDIYSIVKHEPLSFLILLWVALTLCFLEIYLVLNGFIKKKFNSLENKSKIFTFFSGYILPLSLAVFDIVFLSSRYSSFSDVTYLNGNCILLIIELLVLVFSLNIFGTMLMLFVQHSNDNENNNNLYQRIKWICIGNFFGPLLVGLIGILTTAYIFYLAIIFYVSPLVLGVYFYCNYISEPKLFGGPIQPISNSNEQLISNN